MEEKLKALNASVVGMKSARQQAVSSFMQEIEALEKEAGSMAAEIKRLSVKAAVASAKPDTQKFPRSFSDVVRPEKQSTLKRSDSDAPAARSSPALQEGAARGKDKDDYRKHRQRSNFGASSQTRSHMYTPNPFSISTAIKA